MIPGALAARYPRFRVLMVYRSARQVDAQDLRSIMDFGAQQGPKACYGCT